MKKGTVKFFNETKGFGYIIENETEESKENKLILNGYKRDNYQRQMAQQALNNLEPEDWIIINDIDEKDQ